MLANLSRVPDVSRSERRFATNVVTEPRALGAGARSGPCRRASGTKLLYPPRLSPREHALVPRRVDRIADWTQASWGPAGVDTAHMRWNLAITYGLDAADEFLRIHQSLAGALDEQSHWDLVTALDVMVDLDPAEWPRFDLQRLERYLQSVLKRAA